MGEREESRDGSRAEKDRGELKKGEVDDDKSPTIAAKFVTAESRVVSN